MTNKQLQEFYDTNEKTSPGLGKASLQPENLPEPILREILTNPKKYIVLLSKLLDLPELETLVMLRTEAIKRNRDDAQRLIDIEMN